jgi:hypothetical protein
LCVLDVSTFSMEACGKSDAVRRDTTSGNSSCFPYRCLSWYATDWYTYMRVVRAFSGRWSSVRACKRRCWGSWLVQSNYSFVQSALRRAMHLRRWIWHARWRVTATLRSTNVSEGSRAFNLSFPPLHTQRIAFLDCILSATARSSRRASKLNGA